MAPVTTAKIFVYSVDIHSSICKKNGRDTNIGWFWRIDVNHIHEIGDQFAREGILFPKIYLVIKPVQRSPRFSAHLKLKEDDIHQIRSLETLFEKGRANSWWSRSSWRITSNQDRDWEQIYEEACSNIQCLNTVRIWGLDR